MRGRTTNIAPSQRIAGRDQTTTATISQQLCRSMSTKRHRKHRIVLDHENNGGPYRLMVVVAGEDPSDNCVRTRAIPASYTGIPLNSYVGAVQGLGHFYFLGYSSRWGWNCSRRTDRHMKLLINRLVIELAQIMSASSGVTIVMRPSGVGQRRIAMLLKQRGLARRPRIGRKCPSKPRCIT